MKPINDWTKQGIIDHIKKHFKGKSLGPFHGGNACLYRGPDNKKCAVGLFIPDKVYETPMEGLDFKSLIKAYPNLEKYMPLDITGMNKLQEIHDKYYLKDKRTTEQILSAMITWLEENVFPKKDVTHV